jgi:N-acetylglutamate synthase-like GNAT family acetyltransferase
MEVRTAVAGDADAVFRLLTQFAVSYVPSRAAFDRHFPRLLATPDSVFLIAEHAAEPVGYLLGFVQLTLYANGPILQLQELMVEPSLRGRGIGSRLVEEACRVGCEHGCAEVTVATRRAAQFYQRLGFQETALYLKRKLEDESGALGEAYAE